MVFRRSSRRVTRFRRKPVFRRATRGRGTRRRSFGGRRHVGKFVAPFRGVMKKRVLETANQKKNDLMPMFNNISGYSAGPITMTGVTRSLFLFSARPQYAGVSGIDHTREQSRTFVVGFKDKYILDVEGPLELHHRRIVFAFYGDPYVGTGTAAETPFFDSPAVGMTRLFNTALTVGSVAALQGVMYAGTQGDDWTDERLAMTDRQRIKVFSDVTRHYKSTNASSHMHELPLWTPIRKNLVYNDLEFGNASNKNYVSAQDRTSVGDIYVYDYFFNTVGDTFPSTQIALEGRYYWHER